jgi:glycine C-acetyltransferase/8-amino-7-oxononanoate synthase
VLTALAGPGRTVFSDALNHASIIDGCRLARAETFVYDHCDVDHLAWALREHGREGEGDVIVTDSVFSMDGDVAPLAAIVELARRHGARVIVDEAHATGALGPGGRGAVAEAGLEEEVDVLVGTLSKALGAYGGYVCARREIIELLLNSARSVIFSTALPPPTVAGALAALELLIEQPLRPQKLQSNADLLRSELAGAAIPAPAGRTQIVPLIVGEADASVRLCDAALARGVFAQAIRPPTVPDGSSRLRLTVMASHTSSELAAAAAALRDAAGEVGIRFAAVDPPLAAEPVARAA